MKKFDWYDINVSIRLSNNIFNRRLSVIYTGNALAFGSIYQSVNGYDVSFDFPIFIATKKVSDDNRYCIYIRYELLQSISKKDSYKIPKMKIMFIENGKELKYACIDGISEKGFEKISEYYFNIFNWAANRETSNPITVFYDRYSENKYIFTENEMLRLIKMKSISEKGYLKKNGKLYINNIFSNELKDKGLVFKGLFD